MRLLDVAVDEAETFEWLGTLRRVAQSRRRARRAPTGRSSKHVGTAACFLHDNAIPGFMSLNALPVPWVDPIDVSNAILFLASDEARYVTGATFPVDAGAAVK